MLTIVGAGYGIAGQITAEALKCIRSADKLLYLVADPITAAWLAAVNHPPVPRQLLRRWPPPRRELRANG